jgi:site-specific DNA-adenine methylase
LPYKNTRVDSLWNPGIHPIPHMLPKLPTRCEATFFPYIGCKLGFVDFLQKYIPPGCKVIYELFCGSAAFSLVLSKTHPDIQFHLNDKRLPLMNLFRCYQEDKERLQRELDAIFAIFKVIPDYEETRRQCNVWRQEYEQYTEELDFGKAVQFYLLMRLAAWSIEKELHVKWFAFDENFKRLRKRERLLLPEFDLSKFTIHHMCAITLLEDLTDMLKYGLVDKSSICLFLDPPYHRTGRKYIAKVDHDQLARVLKGLDCDWMLTYAPHVDLGVYDGYKKITFGEGAQKQVLILSKSLSM